MTMPVISPSTTTKTQAINDILESIALEETGLAHIINAEGEKIQKALTLCHCCDDLIKINEAVSATLINVIKLQMLLEFKLEKVAELDP